MEEAIEIREELHGNVKVSISIAREVWVFVWKMTVSEARQEAEEMLSRMKK